VLITFPVCLLRADTPTIYNLFSLDELRKWSCSGLYTSGNFTRYAP